MKADQQNRVPKQKLGQLDVNNPLKGTRKDETSLVFDVTTSFLCQKISVTNNNYLISTHGANHGDMPPQLK